MDIISKLSYLPISGSSKSKVQKEQQQSIQEKSLSTNQHIQEPYSIQSYLQASAPSLNISQQQQQPSSVSSASSAPSSNNQPQQQHFFSSNFQQQQQSIQVASTVPPASSSSIPVPGSSTYAGGLLPTWTPPQLTLDDFLK
uniref:Uncharacterized protein n=1 Tax=Panagrolaimus sp. ES5 TaxID=591445 RepID=A0AC34FSR0_9BILA